MFSSIQFTISLVIVFVAAVVLGPVESTAATCSARIPNPRDYVRREIVPRVADKVLETALQSKYQSISYLDIFQSLALADRSLQCFEEGKYDEALKNLANIPVNWAKGYVLKSVGLTGVAWAVLPIEYALVKFTREVYAGAVDFNVKAYIEARQIATHEQIINQSHPDLHFENGWLVPLNRSRLGWGSVRELRRMFTPKEVYDFAEMVYDAKKNRGALEADKRLVAERFRKLLDGSPVSGEVNISSALKLLDSSGQRITPGKNVALGQTITGEFAITNSGSISVVFDLLTVGGRIGQTVVDFPFQRGVTLNPRDSFTYRGNLVLRTSGNYHFFTAYRTTAGQWNTAIPTVAGVTNTMDFFVSAPVSLAQTQQVPPPPSQYPQLPKPPTTVPPPHLGANPLGTNMAGTTPMTASQPGRPMVPPPAPAQPQGPTYPGAITPPSIYPGQAPQTPGIYPQNLNVPVPTPSSNQQPPAVPATPPAQVPIPTSPSVPGAFQVSASALCASGKPEIDLSWSPSAGATRYDVYRNGQHLYNVLTSQTFKNQLLNSGAAYTYYVKAANTSGGSQTSNTVTVTAPNCSSTVATPNPPPTPPQPPIQSPFPIAAAKPVAPPPPSFSRMFTVANTGSAGLRLRASPSINASIITTLSNGIRLGVISGPVQADGYSWWQLSSPSGTGWSATGEWLSPSPFNGATVTVSNTGGIGLRLRASPSLSGQVITTLTDGTRASVVGGPVQADGYTWWNLSGTVGKGWSAVANWLVP